jgi:hypothetical protein
MCRLLLVALLFATLALTPTSSAHVGSTRYAEDGFYVTIAISGKGGVRQGPEFVGGRFLVQCPRFDPQSLVCPADDRWGVNADHATVTAIPAAGWKLLAWHGSCTGTKPICVVKKPYRGDAHVGAAFVSTVPGVTRALPVAFGTAADIADGFRIRIVSVTPNAQLNITPPAGAEYYVANVEATYTGGGSGDLEPLFNNLDLSGVRGETYNPTDQGCPDFGPPPLFLVGGQLFSGQTQSGNVCWLVAQNDAPSLVLFIGAGFTHTTWFALR